MIAWGGVGFFHGGRHVSILYHGKTTCQEGIHMLDFSHETLQTIWFVLWGLLWAVYFILDGFDFGMGTLLPFIAKNEEDRRTIYNAAGPFWDGNEVWLITAGGVTFAAFPLAYAVMFSALYAPLLILLFALIFRAVAFEFRNKIDNPGWRSIWDLFLFIGNFVPALLLGVAFANLFQGIPIDAQGFYHGNLFALLNVYGLLGGVFFVLIFAVHGAVWLALRSTGDLHQRALATCKGLWPILTGVAVAFLLATGVYTDLYKNYLNTPPLMLIPIFAVLLLFGIRFALASEKLWTAFLCSAFFIFFVTFFGVLGMFPALLPSSLNPEASITMAKAASSVLTLRIMLGVVLVFVPIVLAYQFWVFTLFSGKLTSEDLASEHSY